MTASRGRGCRGTAAVELVLVAPVFMIILLFVVGLGRMAHARQQVEAAAADAARAASLERVDSRSAAAADDATRRSLGEDGVSCRRLTVDANLADGGPGGQVAVKVSCTIGLADVALAGFPGSKTFTADAVVPIETHRAE